MRRILILVAAALRRPRGPALDDVRPARLERRRDPAADGAGRAPRRARDDPLEPAVQRRTRRVPAGAAPRRVRRTTRPTGSTRRSARRSSCWLVVLLARRLAGPKAGWAGSARRGLGHALHGSHDGDGAAAELPHAARHGLPAARWRSTRCRGADRRRSGSPALGACSRPGLACGLAVWNSALAIPAFVGMAAGLALAGLRPRLRARRAFAAGLALGAAPLLVARLIGAIGHARRDGLERGDGAAARWLWAQGLADLGHALRGPRRPAGAARRGRPGARDAAGAPWWRSSRPALLVAVVAALPLAARLASRRLGRGPGGRLLALAGARGRTTCATCTGSTRRSSRSSARASPRSGRWRRPPAVAAGLALAARAGATAAGRWRARLARSRSRRSRRGRCRRSRPDRGRCRRAERGAPTRACSSPAASRSRRGERRDREPGLERADPGRPAALPRRGRPRSAPRPGCSRRASRAGCRAPRASAS